MSKLGIALLSLVATHVASLVTPTLMRPDNKLQDRDEEALLAPYTPPTERVTEFIALGDSYTAGSGCNGLDEIMAGGDALRGFRSYPLQMSTRADDWAYINGGDETLPRFSFHAYTGDTTVQLVTEQLKEGPYKDDRNLPRGQPFGAPQLAVVTIGGNDAELANILDSCIYKAWRSESCDVVLNRLQNEIKNGNLEEKISVALDKVARAGRKARGANPFETFQVFVLSYVTFFGDDPGCDNISFGAWPFWKPLLTQDLRRRLNDLTTKVNGLIKKAAEQLSGFGVIFVEGLEQEYNGHRFCDQGHTDPNMIDWDTWFWSPYHRQNTVSEGPGDPNNPYDGLAISQEANAQAILDFVFPGQNRSITEVTAENPPWEWEGAEKYATRESLFQAMDKGPAAAALAPFSMRRSFHPKATAYERHATLLLTAIGENRDVVVGTNSSNAGKKESKPVCASDGTTFAQPPVEDFINTFCGTKSYWDTVMVSPVSLGTGFTSFGERKASGYADYFDLPGTTDKLRLELSFATNGCMGHFKFAQGDDDASKLEHCRSRFREILNGCQTDTIDKKIGGTLKEVCAVYTIAAAPREETPSSFTYIGDFLCKPTDISVLGDDSPLAGTCTCWRLKFPDSTDVFKMPKSGKCEDTDDRDLVTN